MNILIQCGDHHENQIRIRSLAITLKNSGYTPIILMYKRGHGGVFRELSIEVIYLEDYSVPEPIFTKNPKPQDWLDLNIQYNEILKIEGSRRPNIMWPSQIRKTCISVYKTYYSLINIILIYKPIRVIIWNGQTGYVANCLRVIAEKIHKVPVAYLERGLVKNSLFIDEIGVNGASSLSKNKLDFNSYNISNKDIDYVGNYFSIDKKYLYKTIMLDKTKIKKVFFPLQVQRDTNILFYSNYTSMREVFFKFRKFFSHKTKFIIRPHPEEDPGEPVNIKQNENVLVTMEENLEHWIDTSDVVVTINSTVGLEALIKCKPVITLGESIYSNEDLVFSLRELEFNEKRKINYINIVKYLDFLLKNNMMFLDNIYNGDIVRKKLKLNNIQNINISVSEKIKIKQAKIFPNITSNSKLNLTYRKNNEEISVKWLTEIVINRFDVDSLSFVSSLPQENKCDEDTIIVISDLEYKPLMGFYHYVLDIYGNILES